MSCEYCTPQESIDGGAKGKDGCADDGCYIYCDGVGNLNFMIGYDCGYAWTSVPIEKDGFKYCPYCGEEIKKEKFMRWVNQKELDNLLGTMRILANRHENFERELDIYRELGGEEELWFDNLKKGGQK